MDKNERVEQLNKEIVNLALSLMKDWAPSRNQQKQFVMEYIANGFINGSEAVIKAGYSEKGANTKASEMLAGVNKYEHIKPVIDEVKKAYEERKAELSIASGTEVLQYLTSVMRGEQTEQILKSMGAEFGQAIVDIDVGAKDRLKAAEMLGKTHKLFTDKIENATEVLVIQDDI